MKNKLTATQKKLFEILEQAEKLKDVYKSREPFDFSCVNDHCSGRNGKRVVALAWKTNNGYDVYCHVCGQSERLATEDFRKIKSMIQKEEVYVRMEQHKLETKEKMKKAS